MSAPSFATLSAAELDERILAFIEAWHTSRAVANEHEFGVLARELFAYQVAENAPYRAFVQSVRGSLEAPDDWRQIPAVPASAFKEATLATFDIRRAEAEFHTSGTTQARAGRHYLERAALYRASLLAGFDRFMLPDGARLAYLNLLPDARTQPHSSLSFMMQVVGDERGVRPPAFYVQGEELEVARFCDDLAALGRANTPVCITGTAFAFVALLDTFERQGLRFTLPGASRIMETGGFKGRVRSVERPALYARLSEAFGIAPQAIVAEYGMTELLSQYYDTPASRAGDARIKVGPPWLRTVVVDAEGAEVAAGTIGFLRHVDLANRSSAIAIQTEDRGYTIGEGFVLLGRETAAPLRGCSLNAEDLAARYD
ncbi:MAG: hypothetical protein JO060_05825 [Candidatus Eremiobacteraeota bacterium]|nr:hypothetical protein [Candidatus Eremiobacteraeota bacterium]